VPGEESFDCVHRQRCHGVTLVYTKSHRQFEGKGCSSFATAHSGKGGRRGGGLGRSRSWSAWQRLLPDFCKRVFFSARSSHPRSETLSPASCRLARDSVSVPSTGRCTLKCTEKVPYHSVFGGCFKATSKEDQALRPRGRNTNLVPATTTGTTLFGALGKFFLLPSSLKEGQVLHLCT